MKVSVLLCLLLLILPGLAEPTRLTWNSPTEHMDTMPILSPITFNLYANYTRIITGITTNTILIQLPLAPTNKVSYTVTAVVEGWESEHCSPKIMRKPRPPTTLK